MKNNIITGKTARQISDIEKAKKLYSRYPSKELNAAVERLHHMMMEIREDFENDICNDIRDHASDGHNSLTYASNPHALKRFFKRNGVIQTHFNKSEVYELINCMYKQAALFLQDLGFITDVHRTRKGSYELFVAW